MGLESITQQIRQEISKLNQVLHLLEGRAKPKVAKQGKAQRKISAAGRKRIAAAQKKRWAKIRAGKK